MLGRLLQPPCEPRLSGGSDNYLHSNRTFEEKCESLVFTDEIRFLSPSQHWSVKLAAVV